MESHHSRFDVHQVLHKLKHYLPAQAPLKDFVHHNTLHGFQGTKFHKALAEASTMFGYKVYHSLMRFRTLYNSKRIREDVLEMIISKTKGSALVDEWKQKLLSDYYVETKTPRIGQIRSNWKSVCKIDLDSLVHPLLFRVLCSYLDQGISMWTFPVSHRGFLSSIRELEKNSFTSLFKTRRAKHLLMHSDCKPVDLLHILVGNEKYYEQYLFDQQFAHQGWSGMVSVIEDQPQVLLDHRKNTLHDLIVFELLLEIDAISHQSGKDWLPLGQKISGKPVELFGEIKETELDELLKIWQEAFEWSYYDEVLAGIKSQKNEIEYNAGKNFQAMFCLDDRECSIRRYLEKHDPSCETFGTPGFFNVEFFFKPENGKFATKVCPAPISPKHLIKELGSKSRREKDAHFTKQTHTLFRGWMISQTLGYWSAFRLLLSIFRPSMTPSATSSFRHMDEAAELTVEHIGNKHESDLQVGFTVEEMAQRVEGLLKSIGLVKDFAPLVYAIGHGSSSINNPYYAAYDCGACCGRPGSVNARVICFMANKANVRDILRTRGIDIPDKTQFVGGLHDTASDEIIFFDEKFLTIENQKNHASNKKVFSKALDDNSKERSRRFVSVDTKQSEVIVHERIKQRIVSLFEPRPELNHATNALCVIGRRYLSGHLFLDRRAFLNSYDYSIDPDGNFLFGILKAAAPVCGGINLEYFFSETDIHKLGAGTKLPHNVMGLFGVANGADGDLRPGLPTQMTEVHDPVRLLMIVEHFPEVVLKTIQRQSETYEWFINEWINLVVVHPGTKELMVLKNGNFVPYEPITKKVERVSDITKIIEENKDNLPVYLIPKSLLL